MSASVEPFLPPFPNYPGAPYSPVVIPHWLYPTTSTTEGTAEKVPEEKTALPKTIIGLDLETTGLHPGVHGIIQIGAWATGENEDHYKGYFLSDCNPFYGKRITLDEDKDVPCTPYVTSAEALAVNGFTKERIESARSLFNTLREFNEWVKKFAQSTKVIFVCQNAPFDIGFMRAAYRTAGFDDGIFRRQLDTISLGYVLHGETLSLKELCKRHHLKNGDAHDALSDAFTTNKLTHRILAELNQ